ncbi:MAG: hypothetical protein QG665_62 [Patescibacteria group bacterium]|nr:hypothetical protein [Patescibacteria group bacterium]
MNRHNIFTFTIITLALLAGTGTAYAQTATSSSATSTAPVLDKLSAMVATPGEWLVIFGSNLTRTQIFVDAKKVPLANLIFNDVAGKQVKYRVQDLSTGAHNVYALDKGGKLKSNTLSFMVNRTSTTTVATSTPKLVKYVKIDKLDRGNTWRKGTEKKVSWLALGTGEIDILVCAKSGTPCVQVANKTANDSAEVVKMPSTVKVGNSYVVVRKYRDDTVKAASAGFMVSEPSAFMQGKMQLASAWQALENFLVRVAVGE